jgi:hypothetical protein
MRLRSEAQTFQNTAKLWLVLRPATHNKYPKKHILADLVSYLYAQVTRGVKI